MQQALFTSREPSCVLSDCRRYRYLLAIPLSPAPDRVLFILANPSTAVVERGVLQSDPTITRCIGYARPWGYGELVVANARAWRETDPNKVPPDPEAIGPENDRHIREAALAADLVVCGWGKLGGRRGLDVLRLLRDVGVVPHALRLNADASPQHPLYLPRNLRPTAMEVA